MVRTLLADQQREGEGMACQEGLGPGVGVEGTSPSPPLPAHLPGLAPPAPGVSSPFMGGNLPLGTLHLQPWGTVGEGLS